MRLVAGQNGDPRFIPPVALGANYAKQVGQLQAKLEKLSIALQAKTLQVSTQNTEIKALLEQLKGLKADTVATTQKSLDKANEEVTKLRASLREKAAELAEEKRKLGRAKEESADDKAANATAFATAAQRISVLEAQIKALMDTVSERTKLLEKMRMQFRDYVDKISVAQRKGKRIRPGDPLDKPIGSVDQSYEELMAVAETATSGGGSGEGGTTLSFSAPPVPQSGFNFYGGDVDNMEEQYPLVNNPYFESSSADENGLYFYKDVNGEVYEFFPTPGDDLNREIKDRQGQKIERETRKDASAPVQSEHEVKLTPLKLSAIHKFSRLKI